MIESIGTDGAKVKLNVGCGRNILPGWINIDSVQLPGVDVVADISKPLRFIEDSSVDEFLLSHILEHITDPLGLMEELHRIAKPGAHMVIKTPHGANDAAWADPTHVRPYFESSFSYFGQPFYFLADYGYRGDWRVLGVTLIVGRELYDTCGTGAELMTCISTQRNHVQEIIASMEAVKPIREQKGELREPVRVDIVAADAKPFDKSHVL